MTRFRVGNAPISWGVCEIPGWGPQLPPRQVLSEMAQAGYEGTELGPWGYLPDDRLALMELLGEHGLALASAFCPVNLHRGALDPAEMQNLRAEARLLAELGARDIIIADSGSAHRSAISGRVRREANGDALDKAGWKRLREHVAAICEVGAALGLRVCFHPHAGTYVETAEEVEQFAEAVAGLPVGLCLDTGHLAYAGADPVAVARAYRDQIQFCHLKDIDRTRLRHCLERGMDFDSAAKAGVFVPLGAGDVDCRAVLDILHGAGYDGWLVVEQDRVYGEGDDLYADAVASREYLRRVLGA